MTVDDLLTRMSSRELTEWQAYERHAGPIGPAWFGEVIAAIHEQLQMSNYMFSKAKFKQPGKKPEQYPRPEEAYRGPRKHWPRLADKWEWRIPEGLGPFWEAIEDVEVIDE